MRIGAGDACARLAAICDGAAAAALAEACAPVSPACACATWLCARAASFSASATAARAEATDACAVSAAATAASYCGARDLFLLDERLEPRQIGGRLAIAGLGHLQARFGRGTPGGRRR